jgi:hypothetical protein
MIAEKFVMTFDILIGITVGFHFMAMKRDFGTRQPDIKNCGIVFSYLFIWTFILFHVSIIIWSIPDGIGAAFVNWWKDGIVTLYKSIFTGSV